MGYRQPFSITVNKTGSSGCDPPNGQVEVWSGTCCMCDANCEGDIVPCSKQWICEDNDEGSCTGGLTVNIQGQCSCGSLPPGNQCTTADVRTESFGCGCNSPGCGSWTYLSGGSPGDGYYSCPQISNYWDGCDSFSLQCGTDNCPTYNSCEPDDGGECECTATCNSVGWTCGSGPCPPYPNCGSTPSCHQCDDGTPVRYTPYLNIRNSDVPNTYEIGSGWALGGNEYSAGIGGDYSDLFLYHRYMGSDYDIYVVDPSGAEILLYENEDFNPNSSCQYTRTDYMPAIDYQFDQIGTWYIRVKSVSSYWGARTDNSSAIDVVDDVVAGCMDSCATNYNPDSTQEVGPGQDSSCTYSGCTDSLAPQYFCSDGNPSGCDWENSYVCLNLTGGVDEGYTFEDDLIEDPGAGSGTCTFFPQANLTLPANAVFEGTTLTIAGYDSLPYVVTPAGNYDTGGIYPYSDTITNYNWVLTIVGDITDGQDNPSGTWDGDIEQVTVNLPYFDDGGGILNIDLSVSNTNHTDILPTTQLGIGDVDIIGEQISDFEAIYIPGGQQWTYLPSTLPPGEYDIQKVLLASFFQDDPTGVDNPMPWYDGWSMGDLITTRICEGVGCDFESVPVEFAFSGASMFVGGTDCSNGWDEVNCPTPWLGTAPLESGAAYVIQTMQPGWILWTVPSDE